MSLLLNLLGPRRGFDGGLFLPDYKAITARRSIETLSISVPLCVPLQVRQDLATRPLIAPGERVLRGQRLSQPTSADSLPVHAPTSGTIARLETVWTAHDGFLPCAVLEPDGRDEPFVPAWDWGNESFFAQLVEHGVVCPQPRGPAHVVIREAAATGVTDLIVNAMETEPYLTADLRTIVEQPGRVVDATCEIADALGVRRVILAIPYRHRRVTRRIEAEASGRFVEVVPLASRYPQCHPTVLIKTLLDREVPPSGTGLDVGAVVLPLAMVRAAADAIFDNRPLTHALLTIAGDAITRPGTYRVPIGSPIAHLAERLGGEGEFARAVSGGPLTGQAFARRDAVVSAEMTALLFFSSEDWRSPIPCIHCGWCVEDCPVGLDPTELVQLESHPNCGPADFAQLSACIGCGLCSYVCPSSLPLAQTILRTRRRFGSSRSGSMPRPGGSST
jgi:H+/Na+-translocating ferredoxin:NAD+ oxidoreductase subunit C